MSSLKETLRDIKHEVLLTIDEDDLAETNRTAILARVAIAALKRLEIAAKENERDAGSHAIARNARKSLQRLAIAPGESLSTTDPHLNPPGKPEETENRKKPRREAPNADETRQTGWDMGQYATANAFDGDAAKQAKFSRLMGGAKKRPVDGDPSDRVGSSHRPISSSPPPPSHPLNATLHPTKAADAQTMKRIQHDLEVQFDVSVHHKGKKGLGA
ncbi:unnamed protein product [Phytomonas sp. EM1]|nr:unnamed protein product [Phytomonas sp. EM1]|eukprot:CCW65671.1 unnamed protein product [Phytomonas sp. isolate EM1]